MKTYTYQQTDDMWTSQIGTAVRCLLSLKKGPGAWLWFLDAVRTIETDAISAGQIVHAMLITKLADYDEYGITYRSK